MVTDSKLHIQIAAREEWDEDTYMQTWDIRERLLDLMLGFGNGIWVKIRIVPETAEALEAIRGLLTKGGYTRGSAPDARTTLFQQGDECWAGFVFIDPSVNSLS
jgi:hypothetical protein